MFIREIGQNIKLNNGTFIPFMGLGAWEIPNADKVVYEAFNVGFRCVDTAVHYENEEECADGIIEWLKANPDKKREDAYYITKLWEHQKGYENATIAIEECLEKAKGLGYIDLLLIHSPLKGKQMRLETWKAMQEAVEKGIVKSIGVSNYGIKHIEELLSWEGLKIKPVVNEIEVSPWCMRSELCAFTKKQGIEVIAYAPLSHAFRLTDEDAVEVANKKGVSVAQVLIRWSLQKGYIPIPKTKTLARLPVNLDVLSFELTDDEIKQLDHENVHDPSDWEVTTVP